MKEWNNTELNKACELQYVAGTSCCSQLFISAFHPKIRPVVCVEIYVRASPAPPAQRLHATQLDPLFGMCSVPTFKCQGFRCLRSYHSFLHALFNNQLEGQDILLHPAQIAAEICVLLLRSLFNKSSRTIGLISLSKLTDISETDVECNTSIRDKPWRRGQIWSLKGSYF
jgi:hypothetical protein